jgi:PAS domain S-box-containing protein
MPGRISDTSKLIRTWRSPALWISVGYLLVASTWIGLSDHFVRIEASSKEWEERLETMKGLGFVLLTAIALYILIDSILRTRLRTSLELEDARRRYELVISGTDDGIWDWDIEHNRLFWSARVEELLGFQEGELTREKLSWSERLHPDDKPRVLAALHAHLDPSLCQTPAPYDVEYRLRTKDGSYRWFRSRGRAIRDKRGQPIRMAGAITDLQDRMEARTRLRESEERYRRIVETADEGIWVVDTQWRTTFVNARMASMLGYDAEEMVGMHLFEFMDSEDKIACERNMERREQGIREQHEFRLRRRDGAAVWTLMSTNPISDDQGRFTGALAMVTDITQRHAAEAAARESEARFRVTFEHAAVGIAHVTPDGHILMVNDRFCQMLGYRREELTSWTFMRVTHPDDVAENLRLLRATLAGPPAPDTYSMEKRYIRKDGSILWGLLTTSLVRSSDGKPSHLISVVQDISARKRAEDELRDSRRTLEHAQAVGRIGSWTSDPSQGGTLRWSDEVFRIFGLEPSKFDGRVETFFSLIHPDDRTAVAEASQAALAGKRSYDIDHRIVRPDGTERWVHEQAEIERDASGKPVRMIGVVQDITERKEQENIREKSETTIRALLQAMPDTMFRMSRDGVYLDYHTQQPGRLLVPPERFLGRNVRDVLPRELADLCVDALGKLFASSQPQVYEYEYRRRDGATARWECRVVLAGPSEAMLLLRDVTERHNAERRLRESEQRLRLMVENTPLAVISWNPDFTVSGWNLGAQRLFGYSLEEARGRHGMFIVPDAARRYVEERWRSLISNKGGLRASNQNVRKDGELVYCEWYNTPLVDPSGKILGVASLVEDVTDRRLAQQRQDLMMAELDHRVKNNLAAVISLAEQTGRKATAYAEFLDTFMGRLRAMARMHSVLAGSRWQGADLRTLVTQTLEAFGSGSAGRVEVQGQETLLAPRAAQAIAMALNELATNAVKYGALSGPSGFVKVSWSAQPLENGRRRLRLTWSESGGPPVSPPQRRGFGSELIEGAIAYELRGKAHLEFHPDGVVCEFDVVLLSEVETAAPQSPEDHRSLIESLEPLTGSP